jgi:DNA-binding transcriptional regulator YiaG
MGRKKQTVAHLLTHTVKEGDCFVWQKCKDKDGYGVSSIAGRKMPAHRAAYILSNPEESVEGKYILHKNHCHSRACINPEHLYAGTQKQNVQDQITLGTFVKGQLNGKARLNNQDIKLIRSSSLSNRELATMFNVSYYTIWDIRKNRTWQHLL